MLRVFPLVIVTLGFLLGGSCLTGAAENRAAVTEGEARSLVATFIGDKAWELESDPLGSSAPAGGYFHFWVITDGDTDDRLDFFVQTSTGDLYESPGGALMQTRAVLEEIRSHRLPEEYEDSVWIPRPEEASSGTLTLTSQAVTVEYGSLVLTGSVERYGQKDRRIIVEWISLYDRTTDTSTDLEGNGSFQLEKQKDTGPVTIRALDAGQNPSLKFLSKLEWTRVEGEDP